MIKLGVMAKDTISGFTGVVIAKTEWLYGCVRVGLAREETDKDGKVIRTEWFDEPQVKVVEGKKKTGKNPPGGPVRETKSMQRSNAK